MTLTKNCTYKCNPIDAIIFAILNQTACHIYFKELMKNFIICVELRKQ